MQAKIDELKVAAKLFEKEMASFQKLAESTQDLKAAADAAQNEARSAKEELSRISKIFGDINCDTFLPEEEKLKKISALACDVFKEFFPGEDNRNLAVKLQACLSNGGVFGVDAGKYATIKVARAYMRMKFEPWRILKEMDTNCEGTFNQSSVHHMYKIEECGPGTLAYKHGHSAIPGTKLITEVRAVLNRFIKKTLPISRNVDHKKKRYGDHVQVRKINFFTLRCTVLKLTFIRWISLLGVCLGTI